MAIRYSTEIHTSFFRYFKGFKAGPVMKVVYGKYTKVSNNCKFELGPMSYNLLLR